MNLLNTLMFIGPLGGGELIIILIFFVFIILLPIIALIDILRSEFTGSNKLIWILVVIFLSFLGTFLYFIIGTKQKIK